MSFRVTANVVEVFSFFLSFFFFFWYRARYLARSIVRLILLVLGANFFERDQKKFFFFFFPTLCISIQMDDIYIYEIFWFGNRGNNRGEEFPLTRLITTGINIFIFFIIILSTKRIRG